MLGTERNLSHAHTHASKHQGMRPQDAKTISSRFPRGTGFFFVMTSFWFPIGPCVITSFDHLKLKVKKKKQAVFSYKFLVQRKQSYWHFISFMDQNCVIKTVSKTTLICNFASLNYERLCQATLLVSSATVKVLMLVCLEEINGSPWKLYTSNISTRSGWLGTTCQTGARSYSSCCGGSGSCDRRRTPAEVSFLLNQRSDGRVCVQVALWPPTLVETPWEVTERIQSNIITENNFSLNSDLWKETSGQLASTVLRVPPYKLNDEKTARLLKCLTFDFKQTKKWNEGLARGRP